MADDAFEKKAADAAILEADIAIAALAFEHDVKTTVQAMDYQVAEIVEAVKQDTELWQCVIFCVFVAFDLCAFVAFICFLMAKREPARKTLDEFDECFHNFAAVALSGFALSPFVAIAPPVYAAGTAVVSVFAAGFCS